MTKNQAVFIFELIVAMAFFSFCVAMCTGCGPIEDGTTDAGVDSGVVSQPKTDSGNPAVVTPQPKPDAGVKCVPKPDPEECKDKICGVDVDSCGRLCNCNRSCRWKVERKACSTVSHQCNGDCLCQLCAPYTVFCSKDKCGY
jgi:hypothetical protein